jgi:hypothetical protein
LTLGLSVDDPWNGFNQAKNCSGIKSAASLGQVPEQTSFIVFIALNFKLMEACTSNSLAFSIPQQILFRQKEKKALTCEFAGQRSDHFLAGCARKHPASGGTRSRFDNRRFRRNFV